MAKITPEMLDEAFSDLCYDTSYPGFYYDFKCGSGDDLAIVNGKVDLSGLAERLNMLLNEAADDSH